MCRGGNQQWRVTRAMEKQKSQQSGKSMVMMIQELLKGNKHVVGLGFFTVMLLQLINCPNDSEALTRSRKECTSGERGRK